MSTHELEPTWPRVVKIWWSYLWRNMVAMVAAMFIGGIVGFIIGFILGAIGVPQNTIMTLTSSIGFLLGLAISIVPLRMIMGKDFGEFRLVLLAKNSSQISSPEDLTIAS